MSQKKNNRKNVRFQNKQRNVTFELSHRGLQEARQPYYRRIRKRFLATIPNMRLYYFLKHEPTEMVHYERIHVDVYTSTSVRDSRHGVKRKARRDDSGEEMPQPYSFYENCTGRSNCPEALT